jgi:nitrite reductase (NO-forming)
VSRPDPADDLQVGATTGRSVTVRARPARTPVGAAGRVAAVHRQARPTLGLAAGFAVAAGIATVVPHRTGTWLPLHLFLLGTVVLAISGATQLLAVTWGAAPAPPPRWVAVQRVLVAGGAAGLAAGRELSWPTATLAASGASVVAGLALLGVLLVGIRGTAVQDRYAPVIDHHLAAITLGVAGSAAGVLLATGVASIPSDRLRAAHLTLNLLGLVGIVVAGSLPSFTATTAKVRVSARASARRQRVQATVLVAATITAAAGALTGSSPLVTVGLAGYAGGLLGVALLLPGLRMKQLRWAGPRLLQVLGGLAWLAGVVAVAGVLDGLTRTVVLVLVVGGFGQIVAGALAYLGPVLRGGGHERLADGFRVTRSWVGLVAGNVAAVAAAVAAGPVLTVAVVVWAVDLGVRGVRLTSAPAGR